MLGFEQCRIEPAIGVVGLAGAGRRSRAALRRPGLRRVGALLSGRRACREGSACGRYDQRERGRPSEKCATVGVDSIFEQRRGQFGHEQLQVKTIRQRSQRAYRCGRGSGDLLCGGPMRTGRLASEQRACRISFVNSALRRPRNESSGSNPSPPGRARRDDNPTTRRHHCRFTRAGRVSPVLHASTRGLRSARDQNRAPWRRRFRQTL